MSEVAVLFASDTVATGAGAGVATGAGAGVGTGAGAGAGVGAGVTTGASVGTGVGAATGAAAALAATTPVPNESKAPRVVMAVAWPPADFGESNATGALGIDEVDVEA
ncbi:MAG: hypothetical protein ACRDWB_07825 [Acidimicrobiales bacterium]